MSINWKIVPDTNDNLQIGVDWHEEQNDDYYFISPEIYRYDYYYTDNYGGNYWEILYTNEGETNEWGPYSWGSGSGERSLDTFATYTYTRKDSDYDIYLRISWDNSTGAVYNGSFHNVPEGSFDFWITIPAKEITKKTITLEYYSDENTLWRTESKEIPLNTTTNVYFPKVKPIKDGYKFAGWKIDNKTYIKDEYFPVTSSNNIIKIYAQWAKICTVSFIYNDGDKINIEKTFRLTAGSTIDLNKEFGVQSKATEETIEHIYKIKTNLDAPSPIGTKTARRITTTTKEFIDWKSVDETESTTNGMYTVKKDVKFTKPIWINPKSSTVNESIILPKIEKETVREERTITKTIEEEKCPLKDAQKKDYSFKIYIKDIKGIIHSKELSSTENNLPTYIRRNIDKTNIKEIYDETKEYTQWIVYKEDGKTKVSTLLSGTTCEVKENDSNQIFIIVPDKTIFSITSEEIISSTETDNSNFVENTERLLGIYLTPWGESTKIEKFSGWIYNGKLIDSNTESYFEMTKDPETENSYSLGSSTEPKLMIKSSIVSFQPQILDFTLTRCKSDGSLDDDGVYAKITGTLVQTQPYADSSIKPIGAVTPSIKINDKTSENSGVTFYPTSNNAASLFDYHVSPQPFSYCLKLPNGGFLVDSQYKIEFILEGSKDSNDNSIWSVSATDYLTQSFFTIDLLAGGTGLAIGAPSSSSGFINNMETSCTQGFAIYPPQKKVDRDIVVTGGRNLVKQENFENYAAIVEIPETGTYSISSDVAFEVYKITDSSSTLLSSSISADATNSVKWTNSLSKGDTIKIETKPKNVAEEQKKNFQATLKVEKGSSCSAYTPAPEDGATFFVDKDKISLLNSSILIKKDDNNNNIITLDYNKETKLTYNNIATLDYNKETKLTYNNIATLNYNDKVSLNCSAGITLNCTNGSDKKDITINCKNIALTNSGITLANNITLNGGVTLTSGTLKVEERSNAQIIATEADKLSNFSVGANNNTPVYFSNGEPVAWTTPIADYIVAQGKCDFWTYRMWASGVAECWGQTSQVTFNFTEQWGSIYQTEYQQNSFPGGSESYPFSETIAGKTYTKLFNKAPSMINIQFICGGQGDIIGTSISSGMTAYKTCNFNFQRPDTASITGRKAFYALGTWK